jgi:hypothetical protein
VNRPTLVIGGRMDRLVDVRVVPHTARVIRDARLLMLQDVGHVAQMEAPELVARAIVGMLDEASTQQHAPRIARTGPARAGAARAGTGRAADGAAQRGGAARTDSGRTAGTRVRKPAGGPATGRAA